VLGGGQAAPHDAAAPLASAGAWNMAVDDALLASVEAGAPPAIRFYRWTPACLSIGRNQAIRGRIDEDLLARRGWGLVRRPTGGLAVLHDEEITYAVAARTDAIGRPRAAYLRISGALAAGLRSLGLDAVVAAAPSGGPPDPASPEPRCFTGTAPGEVCVAGRKLLGSAQRRAGRALLQHGSLLLRGTQTASKPARFPGLRVDENTPPHRDPELQPRADRSSDRAVADPAPAPARWRVRGRPVLSPRAAFL
jgi:lipoate-protein ligase A